MMDTLQIVLVYLTLSIAVAYIIKKFLLPKSVLAMFGSKKTTTKGCGDNDCGCH